MALFTSQADKALGKHESIFFSKDLQMSELAFEIPSNVICQAVDKDLVVLNTDTEVYSSLDSIGKDFWEAALANSNANAAVASLLEKYDAREQILRQDYLKFTNQLTEMGLLKKIGA